jgi:hypothetical protein
MLSKIIEYFQGSSIPTNPKIKIEQELLSKVIAENRSIQSQISNWIDREAFQKSCFNYGVPDFIEVVLNKELNNDPTYTDFMKALAYKHFSELKYLEIGVSVGKNFHQMMNIEIPASITGFDIEEINPILRTILTQKDKSTWSTPAKSIKKSDSSLTSFLHKSIPVDYLCADVWDQNSWQKLENRKFNLIFSDALHTPEAILFEFEMIVKYGLLDDKFIIVWDDLVGKMKNAFFKIIKKYDKTFGIQDVYLLNVNGWVGQHEQPHSVGIISNFKL